jgi:hypothetical protein
MGKAVVFISHIANESEIAIAFKELIESAFLGMIDVFVSSDADSIGMGEKWLEQITSALKSCSIEIVLCSPESVKRPWINFEAGAGWIREIPVIPLCHSGIEPSKLPLPLNLLQAANASEISSLKLIFPVLASAIGAKTPAVDFTAFVEKVIAFEHRYTFWNECNAAFKKIHAFNAMIILELRARGESHLMLTQTQIGKLEAIVLFLTESDVLAFRQTGFTSLTAIGEQHRCALTAMAKFNVTVNDPQFSLA